MITYRLTISDMGIGGLFLGTTENLSDTQITIDVSEWASRLNAGGVIGFIHQSPIGEAAAIPYVLDGNNLVWKPDTDGFYIPGVGEITLTLIGTDGTTLDEKKNKVIVASAVPATYAPTRASAEVIEADDSASKLPHVTVKGRDMTIPEGIREISVRGDSKSVRVVFDVYRYYDGIDLGMRSFFVEILNSKNQYDTVVPSTEVEGNTVKVTWEVQKKHASVAGQLRVKLKVTANGDYIWQTHNGLFTVTDTFDSGKEFIPEPTLTAVDQALEEIRTIREELESKGVLVVAIAYDSTAGSMKADKTFSEIFEAASGRGVVAVYNSAALGEIAQLQLSDITKSKAVFVRTEEPTNTAIWLRGYTITSDDTVTAFSTFARTDSVVYGTQSLTEDKKEQARKNIGVVPAYINKVAEASPLLESANGEVISVDGSAEKPLHSLVLYGGTKQNTTTGKQFFDASQVPTEIVSGVAIAYVGDGWVSLLGTVEADAESTEVALTIPTTGSWYGIYEKTGIGNPVPSVFLHTTIGIQPGIISHDLAETPQSFMTGSQMGLCFRLTAGDIIDAKLRITLYNADQSDGTWEPYTGGMPSPNPQYPQPLVTVGADGNVRVSSKAGLHEGGGNEHVAIITQPRNVTAVVGSVAVFSVGAMGEGLSYQWEWINPDETYGGYSGLPTAKTDTLEVPATSDRNGQYYRCKITDGNGNTAFSSMARLTIGDANATENPVTVQTATITTPDGLPGVPVASGGNYTDANGQQWITDTIEYDADAGTAKQAKRTTRLTNETTFNTPYKNSTEVMWRVSPTSAVKPNVGYPVGVCSKYILAGSYEDVRENNGRIGINVNGELLIHDDSLTDAAAVTAMLTSGEFELVYPRAERVEAQLPAEEAAQLMALTTHHPNTTIYNDEGVQMDVEYVLETRTYIDKRTAPPPVNLLDNSNFACPINQRELTVHSGTGYTIDRWKNVTTASTLTIVEGGIEFARTSSSLSAYILQYLNETDHVYFGKTYTFAIGMMDGSIYTAVAVFPTEISTNNKKLVEVSIPNGTLSMYSRGKRGSLYVQIRANSTDNPLRIAWAAVYEGEYDADTIPSYCPKARAIEEAECERYYTRIGKTKEYSAHNYDVTKYFSKMCQTPTAKIYSEADAAGKISVYASEGSTASEVAATLEVLGPSSVRVKCESGAGVYSYNYIELTADL